MPNWKEILSEIKDLKSPDSNFSPFDEVRRKYLAAVSQKTGRNAIFYCSAWLQKPGVDITSVNDEDKHAFMTTINGLDRNKGLDLILHTPGGRSSCYRVNH